MMVWLFAELRFDIDTSTLSNSDSKNEVVVGTSDISSDENTEIYSYHDSESELESENEEFGSSSTSSFYLGRDQTTRWKTSEWQSTKERIRSCNIISHLPGPKRDGKNITTAVGDYRKFIMNKIVEKIVCNTNQYISRIRGNFS
ncbi:hypothetical protein LAZ67_10001685 [Cordylochernes scorpioides]|uniref:Uncharacterized protein n=1 Tax=Cordylochernes scorpioides TaxID=51811 RepID=A0ABY6KZT1_9ARAC|nr:hypothetical protein LAZ67_10001685 [Cordylochernes scorpioides]